MPPRRPSRLQFKQQTLLEFLSSSPPSSPSSLFPKSPDPLKQKRKRTRETASPSSSRSVEASDADSDVNAISFEPEYVDISDEDDSPRRPKKRRSLAGAHTIPSRASSDESLDAPIGELRHRKGKNKVVLDSDDDAQLRKRKLIKGTRPKTPEEDDDILDSDNQVLESRLRSRGKMTAFQKNLERFKMSRGKKRNEILPESSSEAEQSNSPKGVPFKGAKPHLRGDSDASLEETDTSSEKEDDSFIVDDDANGVPATPLPAAFSLSTHQDLAHQFKIICQLFVHLAVRPLADRRPFFKHALKEEYLSVPLQVTRRKLSGLRDSLVASSVWNSDFKRSLERYPKFTLVRLNFTVPQCDACHLGGRASTLLGRLSGKPYDEYDFGDLSDDESGESSEDDEDEGRDEDSDGVAKRDVREVFHLGRFCAARTQVYHRFSHWEYSLYKSLQLEIMRIQDDTRGFIKVAYSGGVRPPRDLHDADKVMEWLDSRHIIDMEWQKVRQMMDSARTLERGEVDEGVIIS